MSAQGAVSSNVWTNSVFTLDARASNPLTLRYTRSGDINESVDLKTFDVGTLFVCTSGGDAVNQPIGELYVSYTVELFTPQAAANDTGALTQIETYMENGHIFTTASHPFKFTQNNYPTDHPVQVNVDSDNNTIRFDSPFEGVMEVILADLTQIFPTPDDATHSPPKWNVSVSDGSTVTECAAQNAYTMLENNGVQYVTTIMKFVLKVAAHCLLVIGTNYINDFAAYMALTLNGGNAEVLLHGPDHLITAPRGLSERNLPKTGESQEGFLLLPSERRGGGMLRTTSRAPQK